MNPEILPTTSGLEEQSAFELWLYQISTEFENLQSGGADHVTERFLGGVCECLDVDCCMLWQTADESGRTPAPHFYRHHRQPPRGAQGELFAGGQPAPGEPLISFGSDASVLFPWADERIRRGQPAIICDVRKMPAEAVHDCETLLLCRICAMAAVPLITGGNSLGCLAVGTMHQSRSWTEEFITRLTLVARLLADSLAQRQANQEWKTTFDLISHPFMLLDGRRRVLRANEAAGLFAKSADEVLGKECAMLVRGGCDQVSKCPMREALESGQHAEADIYDKERQRWVRETADPVPGEARSPVHLVFSVEDITERKQAEERLRSSLIEIERLKDRLRLENDFLSAEARPNNIYEAITGQSGSVRQVLHQVEQVAPTDSTVLICGETGTGKELFAEAIHNLSARKERTIVKVNCAALPPPLVESELFGREKGAYTGAVARQAGRFEAADHSTIFLDEIAELSMEVQAKLLRALQEGQFERLGSPRTITVDVRLIAATNHDLVEEVKKGRFRQDLYYRLNVFPIKVPPLRERAEDIPLLVWRFVEEFSSRMGKKITAVPRKAMESLQRYSWPGNIRELRNVIERSVIISNSTTLKIAQFQELNQVSSPLTLEETERQHILKILQTTFWHIKGPHGAASKLGLKPSTLYTRMHKLGIPNRREKDAIQT